MVLRTRRRKLPFLAVFALFAVLSLILFLRLTADVVEEPLSIRRKNTATVLTGDNDLWSPEHIPLRLGVSILLTTQKHQPPFDWTSLDGAVALRQSVLVNAIPPHAEEKHDVERLVGLRPYVHPNETESAAAAASSDLSSALTSVDAFVDFGTVAMQRVTVYRFWIADDELSAERDELNERQPEFRRREQEGTVDHRFFNETSVYPLRRAERWLNGNGVPSPGQQKRLVELRFLALVTPEVPKAAWAAAQQLGFEVWPTACPLNLSWVVRPEFREELRQDGNIGYRELVKLEALRMKAMFDKVFVLDCDIMFHRSLAPLLAHEEAIGWTEGGDWTSERLNSGFLVISPQAPFAARHEHEILSLVARADFRSGTGWEGRGLSWTYGGRTLQGALPHYLFVHSDRIMKEATQQQKQLGASQGSSVQPRAHQQLVRCRYNNMVQLPPCIHTPYERIVSNHFTGRCPKPWGNCGRGAPQHELCATFVNLWNKMYRGGVEEVRARLPAKVQQYLSSPPPADCPLRSIGRAFEQPS